MIIERQILSGLHNSFCCGCSFKALCNHEHTQQRIYEEINKIIIITLCGMFSFSCKELMHISIFYPREREGVGEDRDTRGVRST